ncbi:MAG: type II 3-dehydroquinate dehydratase [Odoribacter sp.]|nr:type II 3-dehydroquinate dehydratase [Odoribacter sp.]
MKLLIINGPNLNLLGVREPEKYGNKSFEDYFIELQKKYPDIQLEYYQSNSEGKLIDKIHKKGFMVDGIIINAGAYTHTSLALADAISAVNSTVIEVHITNVAKREAFRQHSFLSSVCKGTITGFGLKSYDLAIKALKETDK